MRFVFPHAPVRPVTINGGMAMRAWYDISGSTATRREDDAGIRASAAAVTALIDREVERGMPTERIVLAGFSQGGAIALHTALREPRPLGGVLALSTYLPLAGTLAAERSAANAGVPIFMAHGTADNVLAARARRSPRGARSRRSATRRVARVSDGALGLHRGDQRDRCLARARAGRAALALRSRREALAHFADEPAGASKLRSANVTRPAASTSTTVEQRVP